MNGFKALTGFKITDEAKGTIQAVFSTFDVVDSDGDVTRPGAFEEGAEVLMSAYGHESWNGALPVGKGVIHQTEKEAIFDGAFYMDTINGADTFKTVKNNGRLQEWSYGYDPIKYSFGDFGQGDAKQHVRFLEGLKTHEVSPVILGAGVNTRTLVAKSRSGGLQFAAEAMLVLADVKSLRERAEQVVTMRRAQGKTLSDSSASVLTDLAEEMKRLQAVLTDPSAETPADDDVAAVEHEYLRYIAAHIPA
jgi:hypothetical protein